MLLTDYEVVRIDFLENAIDKYAMVPADIIHGERLYTLFTSMFLHADFLHIAGNMLYLYVFGDNVEDTFGHGWYLLFYFLCGLAAAFAHIMSLTPDELTIATLGASGAISGVLGAYLILYPRARIVTIVFYGWIFITRTPAFVFLVFWFIMQSLFVMFEISGGVAYWAHIGGFVAGMMLALAVRGKKRKGAPN